MDLKEIQLIGFKSFADKTAIRFDPGVTCIVGPNGCGKSNIADAVRWVLGEKSAKNLRGSNMQDVIFGGTVDRKQQTYCEVSLVFDNTNHIFPEIEEDEVAMTRRLDRKGIVNILSTVKSADKRIWSRFSIRLVWVKKAIQLSVRGK